jgi:hypothetical protein
VSVDEAAVPTAPTARQDSMVSAQETPSRRKLPGAGGGGVTATVHFERFSTSDRLLATDPRTVDPTATHEVGWGQDTEVSVASVEEETPGRGTTVQREPLACSTSGLVRPRTVVDPTAVHNAGTVAGRHEIPSRELGPAEIAGVLSSVHEVPL